MIDDWKNKKTKEHGVHYSRYIASFANEGGDPSSYRFKEWLETLGLDKEEVADIWFLASNGKLELETSAARFLEKKKLNKSKLNKSKLNKSKLNYVEI